jgi:hypothetical protein
METFYRKLSLAHKRKGTEYYHSVEMNVKF